MAADDTTLKQYRATLNFHGIHTDEVVEVDPTLWAPEISAGYLVAVEEPVHAPLVTPGKAVDDVE